MIRNQHIGNQQRNVTLMRLTLTAGGSGEGPGGFGHSRIPAALGPDHLEKLARWVPKKEMALLLEISERAQRDPDLVRPALLLCAAYGERVARMLDQDPFPGITREIANRLEELCAENGL